MPAIPSQSELKKKIDRRKSLQIVTLLKYGFLFEIVCDDLVTFWRGFHKKYTLTKQNKKKIKNKIKSKIDLVVSPIYSNSFHFVSPLTGIIHFQQKLFEFLVEIKKKNTTTVSKCSKSTDRRTSSLIFSFHHIKKHKRGLKTKNKINTTTVQVSKSNSYCMECKQVKAFVLKSTVSLSCTFTTEPCLNKAQ